MKKVITLITLSLVMFMIGRLTTNSTEHVTNSNTEFTSYVMEGGYVESDVNYESEAVYIKKTFKPNMSISKIKHLLIYMDGL